MQNLIIKLESVDSSNNYASNLLNKTQPAEGTVIWAEEQTSGKGQENNYWESEKGKNLTFSLILFPNFLKIEEQFYLSKVISVGVCRFLSKYITGVKIKWPNDIYAGNEKIAGILIENSIVGDKIKSSVVGIGLNINQEVFLSSAPNPVSMKKITGNQYNPEECLTGLLQVITEQYRRLRKKEHGTIDNDYLHLLYRLNEFSAFTRKGNTFEAKITGVGYSGELVLEGRDGQISEFLFKDIEYKI